MFKQVKIIIFLSLILSFVYGETKINSNTYVYIKKISFEGLIEKNEINDLKKITNKYINTKFNLKKINELKKILNSYFKSKGLLFTKVVLPPQDLTNGTLKFIIIRTKLKKLEVNGNKYFKTDFIKRVFGFKEGDYLEYRKMLKSILLLNSYQDLSVKSYLKKGSDYGTTDVVLNVKDSRPFHATVTLDNLGSQDTSENRISTDINYGNFLYNGDEVTIKSTIGAKSIDSSSTNLFIFNYMTAPLGDYFTRFNIGYMYADYVTTGDLSALDMQGGTNIYTYGIKQPLYYSTTLKSNLNLTYYKKNIKSYLLGALSTKDQINIAELKLDLRYSRLTDIFTYNIGISRGLSKDNSLQSRLNTDDRFIKYTLSSSYIKFINPKHSINISFNSQYSTDRLPLSELFTIGGFSSVRGYKSAQKMGDSGFNINFEWFYHPKLDYFDWMKNSTQIGFFIDYGKIYNNNPIPGEDGFYSLSGYGTEMIINISKKYFGRISIGFPLHTSDDTVEKSTQVYGYIGMKLW